MPESINLDEHGFKRSENETYKIVLFPVVSDNPNRSTHAELIYNVKVTHKPSKFVLSFGVRRLEDGSLIAGSSSKMTNYRAIIDEYKGGRSFEKLSVPKEVYKDIMALIAAAN